MFGRRRLRAGWAILALITGPMLAAAPALAAAGQITDFPVPQGFQGLVDTQGAGMALGADGNLYFGTGFPATIGHITPSGQFSQVTDPNSTANEIGDITEGPDHNIWFTDGANLTQGKLGRITPAGQLTEFNIPQVNGLRTTLGGLTTGPDGNLWAGGAAFQGKTAQASFAAKIDPATGTITEFPTPTTNAGVRNITAGSDGNMWFISSAGTTAAIGRITTR